MHNMKNCKEPKDVYWQMASLKDKGAKAVSWQLKRDRAMGSFKAAPMLQLPSSSCSCQTIFVTWHPGLVLAIQKQQRQSQDAGWQPSLHKSYNICKNPRGDSGCPGKLQYCSEMLTQSVTGWKCKLKNKFSVKAPLYS